jgi:hypothetical protein
MRLTLYRINQFLLVIALVYLAYLPTILVDYFSWGSSKRDGLYLLIVPFGLLPLIIILSVAKYLIVRKMAVSQFVKFNFVLSIAVVLIDTIIVTESVSNVPFLIASLVTLALGLYFIFELFLLIKSPCKD